ncbi:MAG: M20/M25/M40 family metallo-hydrolase [Caldilineaceae bacterium]|jgi:acetylornithine deacetylase/succinyl-diaminopimelate desuccinylase-like protein
MIADLAAYPDVLDAASRWLDEVWRIADMAVQVQQVPAPTGAEAVRASWVERELKRLKLDDVEQDGLFNVYARIRGRDPSPALVVTAHTDTVFPATTDLTVRRDAEVGRIYGPGIGDNSAGVAALLLLAETLKKLPEPPVDIWLVANSGEEGLGDLRGIRAATDRLAPVMGAAIVIEGMGLGRVVHSALGSRRYRIRCNAPGGHSWSDFGTASAVHTLALLAADIVRMDVPESPRTTFNIGRMEGGRSINTIAQDAMLELDLRSEDQDTLAGAIAKVLAIVEEYQTVTWQRRGVTVEVEQIGDRPSGGIPADHPLTQAALRALVDVGCKTEPERRMSSTDANIPLSRGIPAVCVGVTEGSNAHRLEEWISTEPLGRGMRHLVLLTWWAAAWLAGDISPQSNAHA